MDKWDKRFIELAELVASWSSCYQENRQVGAVIVKDKRTFRAERNSSFAMPFTPSKTLSRRRRNSEFPWKAARFIVRISLA